MVEYVLLLNLIAAVAMGGVLFLGQATATEFDCLGRQFGTSGFSELASKRHTMIIGML